LPSLTRYRHRPGRWLRRTRWVWTQTLADLGLRGAARGGPAWLRDNPFLRKAGRAEARRFGLGLRLAVAVLVLGLPFVGGLWLQALFAPALAQGVRSFSGLTFPTALLVVILFLHTTLISSARGVPQAVISDEMRRGTLPDLLLTPLRRAEMLLAMGVGPARSALLVSLAGLPIYLLLVQFGALTVRDLVFVYVLFALLSYAPPSWALPALSGVAASPDSALAKLQAQAGRRPARRVTWSGVGFSLGLMALLLGQVFRTLRGAWLPHLWAALHLGLGGGLSLFLVFTWPFYAARLLAGRLEFFHAALPPLLLVLPLLVLRWTSSALNSGAALESGGTSDLKAAPVATRARTVSRLTARLTALCVLALVWRPWVESGDAATLLGGSGGVVGSVGESVAGLLLLLGGLSLPAVCARALALNPRDRTTGRPRAARLTLRRTLRVSLRPLGVAGGMTLLGCAVGGVSPWAAPVGRVAGDVALAGLATALWGAGVRCVLRAGDKRTPQFLLYGLPVVGLLSPLPALWPLAALSPVATWVRLFPDAVRLIARFPFYPLGTLPPLPVCLALPALVGVVLITAAARPQAVSTPAAQGKAAQRPKPAPPARHRDATATLMGWVTARTDNPLFTYEMRTRTRSGRWVDWLLYAPLGLLAALILSSAYPDYVTGLGLISPFHFFSSLSVLGGAVGSVAEARTGLASLVLAGQCWVVGITGAVVGENLIARDRQRGIWGFLLLTPLAMRQIFWGKIFGQAAPRAAVWAGAGLASLALYLLSASVVGAGPALGTWLAGQTFVAALFILGLSVGAAVATYPVFTKGLRGAVMLLYVALVGGGAWLQYQILSVDLQGGWGLLAERLLLGSAYGFVLSVPLLWFAGWRMAAQRRGDITFGDGPG